MTAKLATLADHLAPKREEVRGWLPYHPAVALALRRHMPTRTAQHAPMAALFLAAVWKWSGRSTHAGDGFFTKTVNQWCDELAVSRRTIDTIQQFLCVDQNGATYGTPNLGLVTFATLGNANRGHYRANKDTAERWWLVNGSQPALPAHVDEPVDNTLESTPSDRVGLHAVVQTGLHAVVKTSNKQTGFAFEEEKENRAVEFLAIWNSWMLAELQKRGIREWTITNIRNACLRSVVAGRLTAGMLMDFVNGFASTSTMRNPAGVLVSSIREMCGEFWLPAPPEADHV
jgi:hypothetical protein